MMSLCDDYPPRTGRLQVSCVSIIPAARSSKLSIAAWRAPAAYRCACRTPKRTRLRLRTVCRRPCSICLSQAASASERTSSDWVGGAARDMHPSRSSWLPAVGRRSSLSSLHLRALRPDSLLFRCRSRLCTRLSLIPRGKTWLEGNPHHMKMSNSMFHAYRSRWVQQAPGRQVCM